MFILKSKYFLWLVLALPAIAMLNRFITDPTAAGDLLHGTGEFSARMMIVAMLATPLKLLFNNQQWPHWLVRNRRYFGVAAFGYALLHTVFYLLDTGLSVETILGELSELGIWTGWLAFLIFVPLALTSNNASQRFLRRRWKQLQRWVYPAAVLTLVHWIFVHNNFGPALVHFIPLAALECFRIYVQRTRHSSTTTAEQGQS